MANNYGKILDKIAADNAELSSNEKRLQEAFEKLDQRLNVLRAGVRIEPYLISKDGPEPATQVALVGEVGGLLDKISKSIAGKVKASATSVKEAESLLDALP